MSDDRLKLINEIFSRPGLWDVQCEEYKTRSCFSELWKEVSAKMGPNVTVDECKRRWKNLRDAYRAEIKRMHIRIERDIFKDKYDPRNNYNSKWTYFEHMKFLKDIKRPRRSYFSGHLSISSNDNTDDANEFEQFGEFYNIDERDSMSRNSQIHCEKDLDETEINQQHHISNSPHHTAIKIKRLQRSVTETENCVEGNPAGANCKCFKRSYHQTHFGRTHFIDLAYVGDSDYNFLISFLPQLKKMNELQNLQFRAKITDFLFTIVSQSIVHNVTPTSSLEK